ncbi:MAG: SDR family NAD(P)-dependent oxidoreductase, partial [Chloroflexota bacterium]
MGVQARFDLSGKVALVTGGSRGIGEHTALALAEAGADVAVASRTVEQSQTVVARVADLGRRSLAVRADVMQVDSIRAMVDEVRNHFGRID